MSIFTWIAFVFRRFVTKQIITRFVEDGSWRYSQLYFSQYKQAYDEFHKVQVNRGGLSDEVHTKYKSVGPTDKIIKDRYRSGSLPLRLRSFITLSVGPTDLHFLCIGLYRSGSLPLRQTRRTRRLPCRTARCPRVFNPEYLFGDTRQSWYVLLVRRV